MVTSADNAVTGCTHLPHVLSCTSALQLPAQPVSLPLSVLDPQTGGSEALGDRRLANDSLEKEIIYCAWRRTTQKTSELVPGLTRGSETQVPTAGPCLITPPLLDQPFLPLLTPAMPCFAKQLDKIVVSCF